MIPHSSLKRLLAHLSNHLLPDNKSSDHRHTHTDRVSYAYKNKIKYDTHPNKILMIYVNYQLSTPDLIFLHESYMKLGPGTFTVLPRNYPFRGPTLQANPAHSPSLQTPRL